MVGSCFYFCELDGGSRAISYNTFREVFHSFVAVVAGGFVGAGLFTSRSLGTSRKMFLKKFKQIFCWPSFDSEGAE